MSAQFTVYRSTDTNAPILTGQAGSLIALLKAVLVDGYGSTRATATILSSGVTPSDGDTITIDGTTYTWKTTLTPSANQVLIGGSATAALANLAKAMGGGTVVGTNYATGTVYQRNVQVTGLTSTLLTLTALKGGTGGNSIAISKSAATITLSGATLAGGAGTDTTAGAGWTMTTGPTQNCGVFKQPAGSGFYLDIDDNALMTTPLAINAQVRGWETSSGIKTGTNAFPTVAQHADGALGWKKSATLDSVARPWIVLVDDRTLYYIAYADVTVASAGLGYGHMFGDFYSHKPSDPYKCALLFNAGNVTPTADPLSVCQPGAQGFLALSNVARIYVARSQSGVSGALNYAKLALINNEQSAAANATNPIGGGPGRTFPNTGDNSLYISPWLIGDGGSSLGNIRGRLRGVWAMEHASTNFSDGQTIVGTGLFAGKTFLVVQVGGSGAACAQLLEISATLATST